LPDAEQFVPPDGIYPTPANAHNAWTATPVALHSLTGTFMPFANFKFPQGVVDAARKEEIIHRTTAMFVEYFGEQARPHSMVLVEEVADGGGGRADETLTLAKMGLSADSA
jgi:4-oxalocrotonate tautomerase